MPSYTQRNALVIIIKPDKCYSYFTSVRRTNLSFHIFKLLQVKTVLLLNSLTARFQLISCFLWSHNYLFIFIFNFCKYVYLFFYLFIKFIFNFLRCIVLSSYFKIYVKQISLQISTCLTHLMCAIQSQQHQQIPCTKELSLRSFY